MSKATGVTARIDQSKGDIRVRTAMIDNLMREFAVDIAEWRKVSAARRVKILKHSPVWARLVKLAEELR